MRPLPRTRCRYQSILRLRSSTLAPQPLNLIRRLVLWLYYMLGVGQVSHHTRGTAAKVHPPARRPSCASAPQTSPWFGSSSPPLPPLASGEERPLVALGAEYDAAGFSQEEAARETSLFIKTALSDVKLYPEFVVSYCTASEHLLVDSAELVVGVGAMVAQARAASERDAAALLASQLRHDDELKKLSMQLHMLEQAISEGEARPSVPSAHADRGSTSTISSGPMWSHHRRMRS